MSKIHL